MPSQKKLDPSQTTSGNAGKLLCFIILMSCLDVQGQCSLMIMVTRVVPIPFLGSRSVPLSAFNAQDTVLLSIQINGSIQISVID